MARITVDDCLKQIPNRFEMSLAATYRARQIANGAQPPLDCVGEPSSRCHPDGTALGTATPGSASHKHASGLARC